MKKIFIWSILTLIITTFLPTTLLAQESTSAYDAGSAVAQHETHVTADEARAVGLRFLNANTSNRLRSPNSLQMTTAYRTAQGDTAFYVFNTPTGFVMVSADRCATPILGYSNEGPFNTNNVPIQMEDYLQGFVEQIAYGIGQTTATDTTTAQQWQEVLCSGYLNHTRSNNHVNPLITATWDQGCYYNTKCPDDPSGYCGGHVPTGCVATAMGMIMHYWGYPLHGTGSKTHRWECTNSFGGYYPEQYVNFGETTYDWANMPDYLDGTSTQEEIDAVATLLWHCGVAVEMGYKPLSSSATNDRVPTAFNNYFGYPDAHLVWIGYANGQWGIDHGIGGVFDYDGWINMLKSNLLLGQPIYYSGVSILAEGGHAWVCDGFDADNLFHFNWGWGGFNNGYFTLFPTALSVVPYNERAQCAVINIHPQCDYDTTLFITVSSNNDTFGSVVGTGTYGCSQICNLSATASNGYTFTNWTENGEIVSSEQNFSFTVYKSRNLVANFVSQNVFTVTAVALPEFGGSVTGEGDYTLGQECTLTAVADSGYSFSYWSENGMIISFDTAYIFSVENNRNIVAHFSETNSSDCEIIFNLSHTDGWINTDISITYDNDSIESFNVQSSLALFSFGRSIHNGSHVEVCWTFTGDGAIYDNLGFEIRYANGTPIFGCTQWVQDCVSFTVDCDGANSPHTVSVISAPLEGGSVVGNGIYEAGATCILLAIPDSGYTFVNWTEDGTIVSTDAMYMFNVYHDRNLTANFSLPFTITAMANPSEYGTIVDGIGTFIYGQTCNLKSVANDGYCFYHWSENGEIVSMDTIYTFVVTSNRNLVATFGLPLNVSASVNPTEGSVAGTGVYNYNQLCILNATPTNGYRFKQWMENGLLVSHNANLSFNVTRSRDLVAVFVEEVDTIPGMLNGLFSVSPDKQVRFSKGNLQYIGSATEPYWKFAENQYDYLGDNGQCSNLEQIDRDLFGWGTSGYNHGSVCYHPWDTSINNSDYSAYGSADLNLYDQSRQADWGYNPIINGGNDTNLWRTLKSSEWDYLINSRNTQSGIRYAKANVNGVNGVILLPDNWDTAAYSFSESSFYDSNIIPISSWDTLESAGAVFLPASGRREGSEGFNFGNSGEYASGDRAPWPNNTAYCEIMLFNQYSIVTHCLADPFLGEAVRLVRYHPEQSIYYVKQNGTGGGSSWDDAMGNLQNAIDFASLGQGVVWVAEGTYFGDGVSESAFVIPDGVQVYGGFVGNEPENYDLSLRDFAAHSTILDGQHTQRTVFHHDDWTYSPVPKSVSILNGFTIQNGYSNLGGNVYGGEPRIQINNCVIKDGTSDGEVGGLANASVRNSLIVNNAASYWGSAMKDCDAYNCIVIGNNASEDGFTTQWCTLTNCILWDNIGYPEYGCTVTYSAVEGQDVWGEGNIFLSHSNDGSSPDSNYVRFVDPENGDFRLAYGSACINAGTPDISALGLPSVDFQGLPRVLDERIDMGAYEYYPVPVVETYDTICEGNSVTYYGTEYAVEGIYTVHTNPDPMQDTVYVLQLTVYPADSADFAETVCGSYEWNGETFTSFGDYTRTFTNAVGCDSVVTLHLTVNQPTTGIDVQTACGNYIWIDGVTYTESNSIATYTLTNAAGCDSIVTLNLTINQPTTGTDVQTACGSFTWIDGITYTESNSIATYTLTNAAGCDSIVTLNLTINQPTTGTDVQTTCGSFTWIDGVTYTESNNTVTYTLTNAAGCDSVVTLNLTINQPTTGTDVQTTCGSYTWIDGITYTESNNTATYTLTNAAGCDSIVTLNLTIFPADSADFAETACDSFEWNGETFTSSGDYTRTLTNASGCDSVVTLHLTIHFATSAQFADTACGSYEWNGQTYSSSGDYEQTFTAANGCDSVVTLHLIINQPTTGTDVQTACGSYTWIDGITYTESNSTATYTLTNAIGCDSIVTLNLTIFPADSAEFAETECDSFEWNGETFTSSGDFTRTLTNESGCDSVVTLHLTIQFATSAQFADTACGSYEWNGQTYSSSGDYEQTFTAANGCDSVVTLHLTVNQPTTGTDVQTACGSYTWIDGITYTESNSIATYTLTNAAGCDSIVTLNLTIFPADSADFAETACDSFEWNGETFTSSGDFTRTLTNASGCDSVVTLHLTIQFATSAQFADTACGSYEWNGQTYSSSGDYEQTFTAANGCDSVVTLHLTITVGIDDHNDFAFNLYPNPTHGMVNIQCTMNNVQVETVEFHVFDAYGKLVAVVGTRCTSSLQTAQIDLSGFTAGVYFVKALADGNVVAVRKVVKR